MSIDILGRLLKFENVDDHDLERIIYRTRVPHVAPKAYLHVIFKRPPAELLAQRASQLGMPAGLREFYAAYNGCNLFSGNLTICGLRPDVYELDREDWFNKALPYNILDVNAEHARFLKRLDSIYIASYEPDESAVCISRRTGVVTCFEGASFGRVRSEWRAFDTWLGDEIDRLAALYDSAGHLQVDDELTLPAKDSLD